MDIAGWPGRFEHLFDDRIGCFAVGYPNPKRGGGPTLSGSLPIVVAILIVLVLIAGLPLAVRRRVAGRRG